MKKEEKQNLEDLTFQQELWNTFVDRWKALMNWMAPQKKDGILLNIIKYIYKIPVLIFVLCISPFVLIFILIMFVAVL